MVQSRISTTHLGVRVIPFSRGDFVDQLLRGKQWKVDSNLCKIGFPKELWPVGFWSDVFSLVLDFRLVLCFRCSIEFAKPLLCHRCFTSFCLSSCIYYFGRSVSLLSMELVHINYTRDIINQDYYYVALICEYLKYIEKIVPMYQDPITKSY